MQDAHLHVYAPRQPLSLSHPRRHMPSTSTCLWLCAHPIRYVIAPSSLALLMASDLMPLMAHACVLTLTHILDPLTTNTHNAHVHALDNFCL
jgi:hypothetical protein